MAPLSQPWYSFHSQNFHEWPLGLGTQIEKPWEANAFIFWIWKWASIVTAVVLYKTISKIPEKLGNEGYKNTTSFLKIVAR